MTTKTKTLCLVAGGSGGHITPALCLGKKWKEQNPGGRTLFFSNKKKLEQKIISTQKDQENIWLKLMNLPGKRLWRYPQFLIQLCIAFFKGLFFLYKHSPEKIISTGGLIAIPVCLAGKILNIPIELYELNVTPGKAVSFLAPLANKIFITFEESRKFFKQQATFVDYPMRFSQKDRIVDKQTIIDMINRQNPTIPFDITRTTIFVLGGSQGSLFLNNLLRKWVTTKKRTNFQIIHQTGTLDKTDWKAFYDLNNVPAYYFSYNENIKDLYLLADTIICRGGAGTLFELEFFQKKSIIIPLKSHALGHQEKNAREMMRRNGGLFTVSDQEEIGSNIELFESLLEQNS